MRKHGVVWGVAFLIVSSVQAGGTTKKATTTPVSESQAPGPIQAVPDVIRVRVGSGNVITFPSRVLRVAVGDPKIVAIHVVEERQILLQGLAAGRSTVFAWLSDGRRLKYDLIVSPRMEVLESALHDLDPHIDVEPNGDGASLVLTGKVKDERVANTARQLAENMLGSTPGNLSRVISLLQFPGSNDADLRLTSALGDVDPRIRLRRIQVGTKSSNTTDAVVLEGRVKDISSLVRAITLAELQLGGIGGKIGPLSPETVDQGRNRNFSGTLQKLQSQEAPPSGLAAYVARGLILKSASGRVLSFLEVDDLPQISVAIRVLQVDRGRARRLGIDYRIDGARFSVGSFQQPGQTSIATPASPPSITALTGGNVVATFVDKTLAIAAAIDFLQEKDLARSVAEPNITTLSGESASVLIGGEVPIPTTTVGTVTSVQGFLFQDFGVRLDIRPTLAPNGLVAMEISPSIIRPSADLSVSGVPGFNVQSVQTTAKVAPGQTLVIGGLISFTEESQKRGVPGFSDIPLLKHLFSWEGRTLQEQEILFVITPRILNEHADDVADALQWRDVEPLPPGTSIELPPLEADLPKTMTPATLTPSGLPPSFHESGSRPAHVPASKRGAAEAPAPPAVSVLPDSAPDNAPSPPVTLTASVPAEPTVTKNTTEPIATPSTTVSTTAAQPAPETARTASAQKTENSDSLTATKIAEAPPAKSPPVAAAQAARKTELKPSLPDATKTMKVAATTTEVVQMPVQKAGPKPSQPDISKTTKAPAALPVKTPEVVQPSPPVEKAEAKPALPDASNPTKITATAPAKADQKAQSNPPKPAAAATEKKTQPDTSKTAATPAMTKTSAPETASKSAAASGAPKPEVAAAAARQPSAIAATTTAPTAPARTTPTPIPQPPSIAHPSSLPTSTRTNTPIVAAQVSPEIRASVTHDYKILVVVSPHPGDAWSRLARRLTGDGTHWRQLAALNGSDESLTSEQKVRVPFEMLRPELKQQIIATLFPKGSAAENDWNRVMAAETKK
jgi:Flp pilus assembly secretin CpaC